MTETQYDDDDVIIVYYVLPLCTNVATHFDKQFFRLRKGIQQTNNCFIASNNKKGLMHHSNVPSVVIFTLVIKRHKIPIGISIISRVRSLAIS